jgi:hypothetical protein
MDKNTMLALNDERNMRQLDKKAKKFSYSFFTTQRRTNIKVNLPQQWYVDGRSSQKVDVKVECLVSNDYDKINLTDDHPYLVYIYGFSNFNNTTNSLIEDGRPYFAIIRSKKSEHTGSNFYIDYRNTGNEFINTFEVSQQIGLDVEIVSGATGEFPFPDETGFWGCISFELSD